MNLYITTRWGNPYEEHGPDGRDTNFLVKAKTHIEASEVTDIYLQHLESHVGTNIPVDRYCHKIRLISKNVLGVEEPKIIHGPWIESSIFAGLEHSLNWEREEENTPWVKEDYDDA